MPHLRPEARLLASVLSNPVVLPRESKFVTTIAVQAAMMTAIAVQAGMMTAVAVQAGLTTAVAVQAGLPTAVPVLRVSQQIIADHHHVNVGHSLSPPSPAAGQGHPHVHLHPKVGQGHPREPGNQCISQRGRDHPPQLRTNRLLQNGMQGGTIISIRILARQHSKYPI